MKTPGIDYNGNRPCLPVQAYWQLFTSTPKKPTNPVALWLRNLLRRIL